MTASDERSEEIFCKAIEITDPAERAAYLDETCGTDSKLRARVEALLAAHERAGGFLGSPAAGVTLDGPARIDGPGTAIGRYELLELIGEGGMGLVYLAEQKEPVRRKVALKIIKPGMDSKQVIARFEAERQALALLDHPNVAHVFDAGTTEAGRPYFVMEYVKGLSITRYCDDNKLTIEQRLRLFEQVCEAVHHAHQKGIIHRDLKPSNILVSVHGDRAVPKIIDFGIAKAITSPLTDKTFVTFQGQLLGTPEYMSPEQVDLATQDIDTRSDIYSLGVVLYELLAGVLPFESEAFERAGLAEIQQTIREREPASPSIRLTSLGERAKTIAASRGTQVVPLARRLHRELEWIPLKAMRKDRCRRYRSASEMGDDVHNYLAGKPLIAGPETAMYRMQKFVRKHAGSVATVALVAIAIVLGLVVSTVMYLRAEDARRKEASARIDAEQARKAEQEQRSLAEQKAEELRRTLYVNSIQLADAKYNEGNIGRVRELLESCPQDLRGWEWDRVNHISDHSMMSVITHQGQVLSIALSPDGKRMVTGGWEGGIKVWDIATGKELITLPEPAENAIVCVAFSPDGRRIVSGGDSGEIKVWDADSGNEVVKLIGHGKWVFSVAFSSDGKHIVSVSDEPDGIKVWDATTGAEIAAFNHECHERVNSAAFSPDGKSVAIGSADEIIRIWDIVSGNEETALAGHNDIISTVSYSSNGKLLASGSMDNTIKIWDAVTGATVMTLRGHDGPIVSVAFSPDGKYLASGGKDCTVRVWDIATGEETATLRGHEGFAASVVFTPDGKGIVSGSWDGTVKVWDVAVDYELFRFQGHRSWINSIAFSPDGKRLVSLDWDGKVKVWDVPNCAEVMTLNGGGGFYFRSVALGPDGKRIASINTDRAIVVWDAETGVEVKTLGGQDESIYCLAFGPDGQRIVSGSNDGTVKLWDVTQGEEIMALGIGGPPVPVLSVAFSPDGQRIVSSGYDTTIKVWDVANGTEPMKLIGHGSGIFSVAFSPDGKRIASACQQDHTAKIWDAATGMELMTLQGHGDTVFSVAFSPDGRRVVTGSRDRMARVWDASTGDELLALPAYFDVTSVAFSPDGKTIAGGTYGKTIVLWESAAPAGGYRPRKTTETARKIVDDLHEKHGLYHDAIDELKADKTLDEQVRKVARQIVNSRKWEDADKLKDEAWRAVQLPDKEMEVYRSALAKAQKANGWEPNDPGILAGLGAAQYRTGAYEQALKTLARAERLAGEDTDPWVLAFRAMTLQRLGRLDEAKGRLSQLQSLLGDERFAEDEQAKALLAEAEGLIEGDRP